MVNWSNWGMVGCRCVRHWLVMHHWLVFLWHVNWYTMRGLIVWLHRFLLFLSK